MRAHKETTCLTKAPVKPQNPVGWNHAHRVDLLVMRQLARRRAGEWKPQPSKLLIPGPLSWFWNSADLLHQAQGVIAVPFFRDLAALDAADGDPRNLYPITAGRDAHQFACVGAARRPTGYHFVPFG